MLCRFCCLEGIHDGVERALANRLQDDKTHPLYLFIKNVKSSSFSSAPFFAVSFSPNHLEIHSVSKPVSSHVGVPTNSDDGPNLHYRRAKGNEEFARA